MWRWIAAAVVCVLVMVGLPTGVAVWYTQQYGRHACQALDVLNAVPVARPANPRATPAREQVWELHQGLEYWARADGCQ